MGFSIQQSQTIASATIETTSFNEADIDTASITTAKMGDIDVDGLLSINQMTVSGDFNINGVALLPYISGPQGPTGESCGCPGQPGPAGPIGDQGNPGAVGPNGFDGPVGITGADGVAGPNGFDGPVGITGADGVAGPNGFDGPVGVTGADGAVGSNGYDGPVGITGADGVAGPNGFDGPVGITGADGVAGPNGYDGPVGITGADGVAGPNGYDGPVGITGADGVAGPNGFDGAVGITGADGAAGPDGFNGIDGVIGSTGITGPDGRIGELIPSMTSARVAATGITSYTVSGSGVGKTITNAGTQAALEIDGVTMATNDEVLLTIELSSGSFTTTMPAPSGGGAYIGISEVKATSTYAYVFGEFRGSLTFETLPTPTILSSASSSIIDTFIAKISSDGVWEWSISPTTTGGFRRPFGTLDSNNDLILCGWIGQSAAGTIVV